MGSTTITLDTDERDDLKAFRNVLPDADTYSEAIREMLRIMAEEGYWDGAEGTRLVTVDRVEQLEARTDEVEEQNRKLFERMTKLRDEVRER